MLKSIEPLKEQGHPLKNDRLLKALYRKPVDRLPIWIMRQAGRYLPEYRATRANAGDFLTLCKTPELACEVTLQPLERFPLDAAIIFSDILTLPDALDLGLRFETGEGPKFARPLRTEKDILSLPLIDPRESLGYVMEAIKLTTQTLAGKVPLIGFAGSPWTVATYMVEGGSSKTFSVIKAMMFQRPDLLKHLLMHLTILTQEYLSAQIEAGARAVMVFDTWGGVLNKEFYLNFSLNHMEKIVSFLKKRHPNTPVVLFTKNGGRYLKEQAATGCTGLGLDWTADIKAARGAVGDQCALQGNLDPAALYAPEAVLIEEAHKVMRAFGDGPGHIFNLGHGVQPDTNPERVATLIEAVHNHQLKTNT